MLTRAMHGAGRSAGIRRRLLAALVALMAGGGLLIAAAPPAAAGQCLERKAVFNPASGTMTYVCVTWAPGSGGSDSDGSGAGSSASCELEAPATFCMGTAACWYSEWGVPWADPQGPKPSPDAERKLRTCQYEDGTASTIPVWAGGSTPEPSLEDQAIEARGNLRLPAGKLTMNPAQRTIVNLPTWLWVDGLTTDELTGSSAFGLVAIATPDRIELDPGDGTGTRRCPWVTSAKAAAKSCSHQYRKASVHGSDEVDGRPAFRASVRAVWSLRFEDGGTPVQIEGVPTEASRTYTTAVPVAESQAAVVGGG